MDLLDDNRQKERNQTGAHYAYAGGFTEREKATVLLARMPASQPEGEEVVYIGTGRIRRKLVLHICAYSDIRAISAEY